MKLFWLGVIVGFLVGALIIFLAKKPKKAELAGEITCTDEGKLAFKFSKPFAWMLDKGTVTFQVGKKLKDAVNEAPAEK